MRSKKQYFAGIAYEHDEGLSHVVAYDAENEAELLKTLIEEEVEPHTTILKGRDDKFIGCAVYVSEWGGAYDYGELKDAEEICMERPSNAWSPERVMFLLGAWKDKFGRKFEGRESVPRDFLEEMVVSLEEKFGYRYTTGAVDMQLQWAMDDRKASEIPDTMGKTWSMNRVLAWYMKVLAPKKAKASFGFLQTTGGYVNPPSKPGLAPMPEVGCE